MGIAYQKIDKYYFLKNIIQKLKNLYTNNLNKTLIYQSAVQHLSSIFSECKSLYAFVKGSFLIPALYKTGQRTANDIDILIDEKDIGELQSILIRNGFQQGTLMIT